MNRLTDLPNIGRVRAAILRKIGVETPEQLRKLGSMEALRRIRVQVDPGACLNQLQALEGAIEGIPKKELAAEKREELRAFFQTL